MASGAAATEPPPVSPVLVVAPGSALRLDPVGQGDRAEAALDGGLLGSASALAAPASGDHWLAVASRDAVGNVSAVRWIRLRVDGESPRVTLTVTPPPVADEQGRPWVPGAAKVEARAVDALAGLARVSLEAGGRQISGDDATPLVLPLGEDGASVAHAVDRVGNRSADATLALNVDARPPSGRIVLVGSQVSAPTALVVGPEARLQLDREDEGSGVASWTGTIDGRRASAEEWRGPLSPGRHEAAAEVVDRVGNVAQVAPVVFEVDAVAPAVRWKVESPGGRDADGNEFFRSPVAVSVQAEDATAGVAEIAWSDAGREWVTTAGSLTTAADSILIRARDRVGNEATTKTSWRLDDEPPRVTIDGEELDPARRLSLARPAGHGFRIAARDAGVGVRSLTLSVDGAAGSPAPDVLQFMSPGRHRLVTVAVDRLGNTRQAECEVRIQKARR